jgi:hypothetical protein
MRTFLRNFLFIAATASTIAVFSNVANGQAAKVESEKPTFDDLPSPEVNTGKAKSFKPKDWLEVEAKINVDLRPVPPSKTCERLTVKWYVAVKNPDKPGSFLLLTKDIEHVNVPLTEDVFVSVYLSPASLKRITGLDGGGKGAVELVGFEVLVNGQKVSQQTNKGKEGWWLTSSDKISRSDTVPLLNKNETPFAMLWWDRYAEIAQERR